MARLKDPFKALKSLSKGQHYYSLPTLEEVGLGKIQRLPISIRIMLESLLRNCDGLRVKEEDVRNLAKWNSKTKQTAEIPFVVSRVLLQDFTGVPLLVDLAAMRDAAAKQGFDPRIVEPEVPVDLVIDHSVQVDRARTNDALQFNLDVEFQRNQERYTFLKWGQQAFETFKVVPPGIGIVHQVNLEHIATVVTELKTEQGALLYLDTLVGTDSHTTMVNGLGVLGWGVGGIEAEAAMLGQPVSMQMPEVIGVHLTGRLKEGVTATDLTLRITEMLRQEKVVGKFVEFCGEGAASLTVADRATIGNMAPEYGATVGFFPVDEQTLDYLRMTGRSEDKIKLIKEYLSAQKMFGIPHADEVDFTKVLELDLSSVTPCVAGPKRPQDRVDLQNIQKNFRSLLNAPTASGGYNISKSKPYPKVSIKGNHSIALHLPHDSGGTPDLINDKGMIWSEVEMVTNRPNTAPIASPGYSDGTAADIILTHGSIVIAAITSCTNTSNPSVMLAAGLVAKKAVERGLSVNSLIKTSLAPGSRIVTDYLEKSGLQPYLNELGFHLVAYGCTTCIGNSGPLDDRIEDAIKEHDIVAASVLSGNRNFEARIHGAVKANFLMSPPLVVAFALAGRVDIDMEKEPLGHDKSGKPVFLRDIWPSSAEVQKAMNSAVQPAMFVRRYANIMEDNPMWKEVVTSQGARYDWDQKSTYIRNPPYFLSFSDNRPERKSLRNLRALALFGDSVTTDHISPAGAFHADTPAGEYLLAHGIKEEEFNSYGSRRGNHEIMIRGTFANVRIRNKMAEGKEGGFTKLLPEGKIVPIFTACEVYEKKRIPLIVFAGKDYGMGSSRDWAAKGPALLGVRAVVASSFERIHRSNLIGMGILPLEFQEGVNADTLGLTGEETFSITGIEERLSPGQTATLEIERKGKMEKIPLTVRLDTSIELEYYLQGGILPYVLRQVLGRKDPKRRA